MICVIDCRMGNIEAFLNIYKQLNIPAVRASSHQDILQAEKLILPGVGAFDWAMQRLLQSGLHEALNEAVLVHKTPILGVCIGMHMMAQRSEEGCLEGLGWIEGEVKKLSIDDNLPLPHMGWNKVIPTDNHGGLFKGLEKGARFYFLHSYYIHPASEQTCIAQADYGGSFACAVRMEHIFGVQFHPEKSHQAGIKLLWNFAKI